MGIIMNISAENMDFRSLNQQIRDCDDDIWVDNCFGQRFIGSGRKLKSIYIKGTPGNALGAYLDGATITVDGNAQDAVGDTMNDGKIIIHGNAGDALGYSMRGGKIYVKGNAGYRTGIHMKEYKEKKPVIIVGGRVGSFLGEYLAGGLIVVLGFGTDRVPVGNFTGTGMHGGKIFLRTSTEPQILPKQVTAELASIEELAEIKPYLNEYCGYFGMDADSIIRDRFYVLKPNAKNPYKRLYTEN